MILQSTLPLSLNLVLLLFLVPGYAVLQGWLNSTVQVDSNSRLDKIFITVLGGFTTLYLMIFLLRFGVYDAIECWFRSSCTTYSIGYNGENGVNLTTINNQSALFLMSFIATQTITGYVFSYLAGTAFRINTKSRWTSEKELEQPLETVIDQSTLGENITVITRSGDKIVGKLYRVGSPSEDKDLLLSGAERHDRNGGGKEKIGITYLEYEDISQIQFPHLLPEGPGPESNFFLRQSDRISEFYQTLRYEFWYGFYIGLFSNETLRSQVVSKLTPPWVNIPRRIRTLIENNRVLGLYHRLRKKHPAHRAKQLSEYLKNK